MHCTETCCDRSLQLDGNQLSGTFPTTVTALTRLNTLRTCGNQFSGSLSQALLAFIIARPYVLSIVIVTASLTVLHDSYA